VRYGTGVPALEAAMLDSKGDRYRRYQDAVSVLLPLPPRRRRSGAPEAGGL
jgi:steroid 5-alpha reductase family enzyme